MRFTQVMAGALLAAIPALALAAPPTITDNEEHVFRGFFDRQSGIVPVHKLALEKGSADIKTFAQSEMDMLTSFGTELGKLGMKFGLVTRGMQPGEASPKLGQGLTRGFETLPEGARWFSTGVNIGGGTMPGMPGGAAPQAGAPAGASPAGAAPGAAPGAAGMAAGGMRQTRYDYDLADLQKLNGKDFDKQYLLRVAIAHNAQVRHLSNNLNEAAANADMIAFAKASLKTLAQQNSKIENLLSGQGLNAGPPPARAEGAAPQGGAPGGAPAAR